MKNGRKESWFSYGNTNHGDNREVGAFFGWESGDWRPCFGIIIWKWFVMIGPHIQQEKGGK